MTKDRGHGSKDVPAVLMKVGDVVAGIVGRRLSGLGSRLAFPSMPETAPWIR
jgi:hypothetical protein